MIPATTLIGLVLLTAIPARQTDDPKLAPKGPPPLFVRIVAVDPNEITVEKMIPVPVTREGTRIVEIRGQKVTERYLIRDTAFTTMSEKLSRKSFRLMTVAGKEVAWSKAEGAVVLRVLSPDGIDPAYKTLLMADALVIVPKK